MRDVRLTYLVSFFFCLVSASVFAAEERAKCDVFRLHPTQPMVGQREVLWRKEELRALLAKSPAAVKKFLKEEPGEVVKGPANSLWLVDGHHHAKALAELKKEDRFSSHSTTTQTSSKIGVLCLKRILSWLCAGEPRVALMFI